MLQYYDMSEAECVSKLLRLEHIGFLELRGDRSECSQIERIAAHNSKRRRIYMYTRKRWYGSVN